MSGTACFLGGQKMPELLFDRTRFQTLGPERAVFAFAHRGLVEIEYQVQPVSDSDLWCFGTGRFSAPENWRTRKFTLFASIDQFQGFSAAEIDLEEEFSLTTKLLLRFALYPRDIILIQRTSMVTLIVSAPKGWQILIIDRGTGAPLPGVEVGGQRTNEVGVCEFSHMESMGYSNFTARLGSETLLLPGLSASNHARLNFYYTFQGSDRFSPGDEAHLATWFKTLDGGRMRSVNEVYAHNEVVVSRSKLEGRGVAEVLQVERLKDGLVENSFHLPESVASGSSGAVRIALAGGEFDQLSEFKAHLASYFTIETSPQLPVSVCLGTKEWMASGESLRVKAEFLLGEAVAGAKVRWEVSAQDEPTPTWDGWEQFNFGTDTSFSIWPTRISQESVTDSAGVSAMPLRAFNSRCLRLQFECYVEASQGGWFKRRGQCRVHPSALTIGMRSDGLLSEAKDIEVDLIVLDLDGNPREGVECSVAVNEDEPFAITTATTPTTFSLRLTRIGENRITAHALDEHGNKARTSLTVFRRGAPPAQATLHLDKNVYQIGESAKVLVGYPRAQGAGVLRVGRVQALYSQAVLLDRGYAEMDVVVTESMASESMIRFDYFDGSKWCFSETLLRVCVDSLRIRFDSQLEHFGGQTQLRLSLRDRFTQAVSDATLFVAVTPASRHAHTRPPLEAFYPKLNQLAFSLMRPSLSACDVFDSALHLRQFHAASVGAAPTLEELAAEHQKQEALNHPICGDPPMPEAWELALDVGYSNSDNPVSYFGSHSSDGEGTCCLAFPTPSQDYKVRIVAMAKSGLMGELTLMASDAYPGAHPDIP